jgi:hypothetical protein
MRRWALGLLALLGLDLGISIVTGGSSPLALGGSVGVRGFVCRLVLLGALLVFAYRLGPREPARRSRLLLSLLLLPTLLQFQFAGGRMSGDGVMYYVYVRSFWKDFDVDLTNEYTHYGLIARSDLGWPTKTGLRRSIFAVGPAVLWTPFFAVGEGVACAEALFGRQPDLSGYGPEHRNAVALGSLLYGFAAVLLIHALLRRHFAESTALLAALLAWLATFLHWYMVQQPTMSHAPSAFAAALVLWLWDRDRGRRDAWGFFILGLAVGVAMCVRWQSGVLLLLPAFELTWALKREARALPRLCGFGALVLLGTFLGAVPQLAVWKALYDEWVLRYPPHGADFVRLGHPFLLQTLFSSRHGLLSWTPVFWLGYLGFLPLVLRRRALALPLLVPLALMTYVNMCSGDWWAGGSFSNRRFDSLLPILALGFAASLEALRRFASRNPRLSIALMASPLVFWNLALAEELRQNVIPRDDTAAFPRMLGGAAQVTADLVGSPTTWPASWIFAWQHGRPPSQYDLLVGKYLFYRQNNMAGHLEVGVAGDEALLGEGFSPIVTREGVAGRRFRDRARLFAPLDVPEDLALRFRTAAAAQPCEVRVAVNGREAGRFLAGPAWSDARIGAAAAYWQREINEIELQAAGCEVWLDAVDFERAEGRRG